MAEQKSNLISSISISGEIVLNLHSLNNEGGEGNQIMTRQVTIVDKNKEKHTVTAISGDMFKHIHAMHMVNYCTDNNLSLSDYSKTCNPNRISASELVEEAGKQDNTQADVINAIIKKCSICDIHGVLNTDKVGSNNSSSNTPRQTVIDFGWIVGIPGNNGTETYIHTKLVPDAGAKGSATGSNEGQNIFHRPVNYGTYAFVCNIEVYRIGFNDISRTYPIGAEERLNRYKAMLHGLVSTIINPRGAMIGSQYPHITDFRGIITYSHNLIPAPTVSAINPDYSKQMESIVVDLNKMQQSSKKVDGNAETDGEELKVSIEKKTFDSISAFVKIVADDLMSALPYKIS